MITTSEILEVSPQHDGRLYVKELHVHGDGREEFRISLNNADDDLDALLAQHAEEINARETTGE